MWIELQCFCELRTADRKALAHLEVVELKRFVSPAVEVICNKEDSNHQKDQEKHPDPQTRRVCRMHLLSQHESSS